MRQKTREAANNTTADVRATKRVSPERRPVRASVGIVVAKATGTMNVSAKRSHPGYKLTGQRPASYML